MSVRTGVAVLACVGFWIWLATPACGCSTRRGAAEAAMKSDLRNLVSQQEIHYADWSTYGDDLAGLGFVNSDGVKVAIEAYGADGWLARAQHRQLPGADGAAAPDCVVYGGRVPEVPRTSLERSMPEEPGEVACDLEPGASVKYRIQRRLFRW